MLFAIATLLIAISLIVGTTDNIPMIALLLIGIIFLYFTLLHTWRKASYFAILTTVCFVILIIDFIWPFISEGVAMTIGFCCFAGIVTGIIGIFTRLNSWKRLPYAGSLLSLVALLIFTTSLNIPFKQVIQPWIISTLIGTQIIITLLLFFVGLAGKKENGITKVMLIVSAIVLIFMSVWAFYASTLKFGDAAHSIVFVVLATRVYAVVEIIVASLLIYASR